MQSREGLSLFSNPRTSLSILALLFAILFFFTQLLPALTYSFPYHTFLFISLFLPLFLWVLLTYSSCFVFFKGVLAMYHIVKNSLEKEMATHSSVLAWRIPGTEEPCRLPSVGSHRVGHDWGDLAAAAAVAGAL